MTIYDAANADKGKAFMFLFTFFCLRLMAKIFAKAFQV
ncbi:hypothetical protein G134_1025 [Lactobacillus delbrueckii subsp. lactis CRL581]|nr:hypothetical protein G134_1025 [Lactobacillus delbrueckii subsp. lactis CRL581]